MYKRYSQGWSKHMDFMLLDEIVLQIAYIIASLIRHHNLPYGTPLYRSMAVILSMADIIIMIGFNTLHDVLKRGYYIQLTAVVKQAVLLFLFTTAYAFATQTGDAYSRILLTITALLYIPLCYGARLLWKMFVIRKGGIWRQEKVSMILVTDEDRAEKLIPQINDQKIEYRQIVGLVLRQVSKQTVIKGVPIIGTLETAADYICRNHIDSVYIDLLSSNPDVQRLMDQCSEMAVPIHYHIPGMGREGTKQFVERIGDTTVLTKTINYATPLQRIEKRALDILGGIVGSVIALIIMAIVGPMIKMKSPGPIIYRQTRIGQNGKKFQIMKIRSMYMDADKRKQELMEQNRVKDGMMFKLDWDPRIIGNEILPDGTKKTGIGEFIRKTSLDEFPQFFNVLKGEMSLVGTRPPTEDEWNKYEYHHRARLACKPGITGMWQISGRSNITDFEEVVKLDTYYINHWSMGLDLKILFKTIGAIFTRKGAM